MEAKTARDAEVARGDDDPLDPPAGRDALRRPAAVGRRRARRDVELAARDPRRADRRARRRADRAGARARQAARRAGARRRPDLAQPARHLRGGDRITVLRLGRNVGVYEREKTTQQEIVQAITAGVADEGRRDPGDRGRSRRHEHATPPPSSPSPRSTSYAERIRDNVRSGNLGSCAGARSGSIVDRRLLQLHGRRTSSRPVNFIEHHRADGRHDACSPTASSSCS